MAKRKKKIKQEYDKGVLVYAVEVFGDDNIKKLDEPREFLSPDYLEIDIVKFRHKEYYTRTFLVITNDEFTSMCADWRGMCFENILWHIKDRSNRPKRKWTSAFRQFIKLYKLAAPKIAMDGLAEENMCHGPDWFYFPDGFKHPYML